jgi:hypothetical protein
MHRAYALDEVADGIGGVLDRVPMVVGVIVKDCDDQASAKKVERRVQDDKKHGPPDHCV